MADTERTLAQLFTIFKDGQPDGSVVAQDMRDLIVSLTPAIGAIYFSTSVETVINVISTKTLALGTTSLVTAPNNIDMPQNNRIRYVGAVKRHFEVTVSIAATAAGNNKTAEYQLFKNGSALTESLMEIGHGTGSEIHDLSLTTNVELDTNDFIELYISNETDTTNLTIQDCIINLFGFVDE